MLERFAMRTKLIFVFSMIIAVNISVGFYYSAQVDKILAFNQVAQYKYTEVTNAVIYVEEIQEIMEAYQKKPVEEMKKAYKEKEEKLLLKLNNMSNYTKTNQETYHIRALQNAITTQCNFYDKALHLEEDSDDRFYDVYYQGFKISQYIQKYFNEYLNLLVESNLAFARVQEEETIATNTLATRFIIVCNSICLLIAISVVSRLTKPIRALADASRAISQGDYTMPHLPVVYTDEVGELTAAFNKMKDDVAYAMESIVQRAELEAYLYNEELKNIKNEELLKEAQYLALQSQINPHFLFNTLNAISRAIASESKQIAIQLVCCLADLFRYNLEHLNTFSTLQEELDVVDKYIYIQQHRFGERVHYDSERDSSLEDILIPSMLLQPLVENSLIHGIEGLEKGGTIKVKVRKRKGKLRIQVYDNGVGIPKHVQKTLLTSSKIGTSEHNKIKKVHTGHTTGIGVANIQQRLALIEGSSFKIYSKEGRGTLIELVMPLLGGGMDDV